MFAHYPYAQTSRDQVAQLYSGLGAGLTAASVVGRSFFSPNSGMYLRSGRVVGQRRRRTPAPAFRNVRPRTTYAQARTVRRRMPVEGRGVTNQHDRQLIYKKRRMPKRLKRRWRSFKRKVSYIAEKNLGTNTVVFNGRYTFSNSNLSNHGVAEISLYGQASTQVLYSDLRNIGAIQWTGDFTAAAGYPVDLTTKFYFQSAVVDVTMRNVSEFTLGGDLNTAATLEVDLYEISVNKSGGSFLTGGSVIGNAFNGLIQYFGRGDNDTKVIGNVGPIAGASSIEPEKRGTTPWDHPDAISKFGIKIWKKTKFFIASGQTSTYQYRDPRRHVTSLMHLNEATSCNKVGWTRHILVIFKAVPGINIGSGPGETTEKMTIGVTRKYMYKQEGVNQTRDVHIAQ